MPLHLLGKKSWNPYAPAAIARVKADEEAAAEHERDLDELRDDYDARVRLARLRGESPPPPPPDGLAALEAAETTVSSSKRKSADPAVLERRKKRRLPGEDDTDRDLRLAREQREVADADAGERAAKAHRSDAPIIDKAGHIQLFAPEDSSRGPHKSDKNPEAEAERLKKQREYEDQYTMRFSNAAGFRESVKDSPWYLGGVADDAKSVGRNAFGREDQGRHQRDAARASAADPMAAMKAAQAKLKDVRRARESIQRERDEELRSLKEEQERAESRRRHRHRHGDRKHDHERDRSMRKHNDPDKLEGFSLDAPESRRQGRREHGHRHNHREERSNHSNRHGRDRR